MSIAKDLKDIKRDLEVIKDALVCEDELYELEKEYKEYKFFADTRGMKLLADKGLVDEYNHYMTECEIILFAEHSEYTVKELPKPSSKLEAFKNKFNKFFK